MMKKQMIYINNLIEKYPILSVAREDIIAAYDSLVSCYENGNKLLLVGNGGSSADADHIVGELMKNFRIRRPIDEDMCRKICAIDKEVGDHLSCSLQKPLTAINLVSNPALSTAYINDIDCESVYAQQLLGYGKKDDVIIAISTSGNSRNIIDTVVLAKAMGIKSIVLTGNDGGRVVHYSDISIVVPESETYLIQEYHICIYHCICMMLEDYFFG